MATPIGSTPDGGIIVQESDGTTHVVQGNSVTPAGPDVGAQIAAQGGGSFNSAAPATGPAPDPQALSTDIPGPLRMPAAFASGLFGGADGGALALNEARHPNLAAAGQMVGSVINPGRLVQNFQPQLQAAGDALGDFLMDRDPATPASPAAPPQPGSPAPAAPAGAPQPAAPVPPQGAPAAPGKAAAANGLGSQGRPGTSAYDQATKEREQGLQEAANATADKEKAIGAEQGKQATLLGQFRDQYLKRSQEIQADGAARLKAMDDTINSGKSAQLDPEQWQKSRTGGQQVFATIALALGAGATAFGAKDAGGDMVRDAIARNIDAQKFNIQQASQDRRDKLAGQQSAFGHFLQLTGNEQAAQAASMAWGLKQAELQVDALSHSLSAPEEIAKAKAMKGQLGQEAAQYHLQAAQIVSSLKTQELQREQMRTQMDYQKATREMLAKGQVPPEMADRAIKLPDGRVVVTGKAEEADKLRVIHRATSDIDDATAAMAKIVKSNPVDVLRPGSEANREYNLAMDNVINLVNPSKGINAQMQDPQRELYKHGLDPTVLGSTDALLGALASFRSETKHSANKAFSLATGVSPFSEATPAELGFKPMGGR